VFSGKRILLGIGGGIAAYRVAELARLLMKQGAEVRTVMTRSACEFITPMSMEALTGEAVHSDIFDLTAERDMGHIQLARWADVLLVAPATTDLLAKFAHGICDNLLTTLFQARRGPILLAPAMNVAMWQTEATQRNVQALTQRGMHFCGPEAGDLACGEFGLGRLSEPQTLLAALVPLLVEQDLIGQRWLINTGPTWEAWDDVRVLSNRASGRFGVYLADAAAARGAVVTLVAGPRVPESRQQVERVDVISAQEMLSACEKAAADSDVFVATAAVSDYRFSESISGKLKRGNGEMTVRLIENSDIVAHIAAMQARPKMVVACAAEAESHIEKAHAKMLAKGADAIFANNISRMGDAQGAGWWITERSDTHDAVTETGSMDKAQLAAWLVARIRDKQLTEKTHD